MKITVSTLDENGWSEPKEVTIGELEDVVVEEARKARESIEWCECGDEETFGEYPQDGECDCGIHKHHVHCGTCGKVSQLG